MNFCEFIPQSLTLMDNIQHQSPALEHIEIGLLQVSSNVVNYQLSSGETFSGFITS